MHKAAIVGFHLGRPSYLVLMVPPPPRAHAVLLLLLSFILFLFLLYFLVRSGLSALCLFPLLRDDIVFAILSHAL